MKENKNIAMLIPHMKIGGTEKVASVLASEFSKHNKDVHLFLYDDKIEFEYTGKSVILNFQNKKNIFAKLFNLHQRIKLLRSLKKDYSIDATISFFTHTNFYNIWSKTKDKVILTVHSNNIFEQNCIIDYFIKHVYIKADHIVTVSKKIKNNLINRFHFPEEKISVIYNPLDIQKISMLSKEKIEDEFIDIFNNKPVIVSVGRFSWEKAQWRMLKVLKLLQTGNINVNLLFVGFDISTQKNNPVFQDFMKMINRLELNDSVFFAGIQTNPYKFIANSKVLALTSVYEGFGLVIAESMACGVPVVSVDCDSGPREIIAPQSDINLKAEKSEFEEFGVLTPIMPLTKSAITDIESSEIEMARSIKILLEDKDLYEKYSKKGIERAKSFNVNKIVSEYELLIDI
ncbi:MAG: glycosyltransferase [Candidatus Delongbacteria bacterium]|nr:glycosyltransferase [Candidatus Delongbacteria bacterium]